MQLKELLEWIKVEDKRLKERFGNYGDQEKRILAHTVKLTEELGELCDEVLAYNSLQRKEKLNENTEENLAEEFADVLITSLILAENMNIDIKKALEEKINKINKRYER